MKDKKNYVYGLKECREQALQALLAEYPSLPGLFGRMTAFFTNFSERLDGVEIADESMQYKMLLAVSFMRTHVCACEHLFNSENIEGVTLLRKQLELIARMREIDEKDLSKLYDKVPNVGFVGPMKVLYGLTSKIAHSADMNSLDMLGFRMEGEMHKHILLHPVYNDDTVHSINMAIGLFLMFVMEAIRLQQEMIPDYNNNEDGNMLMDFFQFGKSSGIPFFKKLELDNN